MILRRLGNKSKIAKDIQKHFPPHKIYIEPFFGAGGMFFNKPKARYNIVNDLDSDVFNLFQVVMNQKEDLEKAFYMMPIHQDLLEYWKKNTETEPIKKALRFLFLTNLTYMGKMDCLSFVAVSKPKQTFESNILYCFEFLKDVKFNNCDFRKFLKDLSFPKLDFGKPSNQKAETLIYADPPYLNTTDTYSDSGIWGEFEAIDLFNSLEQTKCKFAYSEFNHPFILEQAKERNLNIITIGDRRNLKNRRVEILITNYQKELTLF